MSPPGSQAGTPSRPRHRISRKRPRSDLPSAGDTPTHARSTPVAKRRKFVRPRPPTSPGRRSPASAAMALEHRTLHTRNNGAVGNDDNPSPKKRLHNRKTGDHESGATPSTKGEKLKKNAETSNARSTSKKGALTKTDTKLEKAKSTNASLKPKKSKATKAGSKPQLAAAPTHGPDVSTIDECQRHAKRARKISKRGRDDCKVAVLPPSLDTATTTPSPLPREQRVRVHETSFIRPHASGILAMAATSSGSQIAVARKDGSLELRDTDFKWSTVSHCMTDAKSSRTAVTDMAFTPSGAFLLVTHLDGRLAIFQRDGKDHFLPHVELRPGGEALWSIVCNPGSAGFEAAVGCDDGHVRLLTLDPMACGMSNWDCLPTNPALYVVRLGEHSNGRVLSMSWSPTPLGKKGNPRTLVCGNSEGLVRWINADSGKCLSSGKIPGLQKNKVSIWSLEIVTHGRYVVSGDDRGQLCVWESSTSTLVEEVKVEGLLGTLWCSAVVSPGMASEMVLFGSASGAIGGLMSGTSVTGIWAPVRGFRCHNHDVLAVVALPSGEVMSGSMDTRVGVTRADEFLSNNIFPESRWLYQEDGVCRQRSVQVLRDHRIILASAGNKIEMWGVPHEMMAARLVNMELKSVKTEVTACAYSGDGRLLVVSAPGFFKMFKIHGLSDCSGILDGKFPKSRVEALEVSRNVQVALRGAVALCIDGATVIALSKDRRNVVMFDPFLGVLGQYSLELVDSSARGFGLLACDGNKIVVTDHEGELFVGSIERNGDDHVELNFVNSRIRFSKSAKGNITAVALSRCGKKVAYATASGRVMVVGIGKEVGKAMVATDAAGGAVHSLEFSNNSNSMLVSSSAICMIVCSDLERRPPRRKAGGAVKATKPEPQRVTFDKALLCAGVLGMSEMVGITRHWPLIEDSLPNSVERKTPMKKW